MYSSRWDGRRETLPFAPTATCPGLPYAAWGRARKLEVTCAGGCGGDVRNVHAQTWAPGAQGRPDTIGDVVVSPGRAHVAGVRAGDKIEGAGEGVAAEIHISLVPYKGRIPGKPCTDMVRPDGPNGAQFAVGGPLVDLRPKAAIRDWESLHILVVWEPPEDMISSCGYGGGRGIFPGHANDEPSRDEFPDGGIHDAEEAVTGSEDSCMQGCEESGS